MYKLWICESNIVLNYHGNEQRLSCQQMTAPGDSYLFLINTYLHQSAKLKCGTAHYTTPASKKKKKIVFLSTQKDCTLQDTLRPSLSSSLHDSIGYLKQFLSLGTMNILARWFFILGDPLLCTVEYLEASMTYIHQIPAAETITSPRTTTRWQLITSPDVAKCPQGRGCPRSPQLTTIGLRLKAPLYFGGVKINLGSSLVWPGPF